MTTKANASKIATNDWQNLPIEKWNVRTTHQFLIDETKRRYNVEYVPGGGGPKSQRWRTEQGMIKREIDKRGAAVVKRFIEICWREYRTSDPKKYPYPTFGFCLGYLDRHWTEAERYVEASEERTEIAERDTVRQDGLSEIETKMQRKQAEEWF